MIITGQPLGNGPINSGLGGVEKNWPKVEEKIDGGTTPSEAFDETAGYSKPNKQEFTEGVMKPADDAKVAGDSVGQKQHQQDVRNSADFDWSGGDKEEYNSWVNMRHEIEEVGNYPKAFSEKQVDEVIDKFNNMERPSGKHPTIEKFNDRPGKPAGNPNWPAGPK